MWVLNVFLGLVQALFRALKTKHETPKYGLIYHASLIGQAAPKFKGKISRVLAAKSALSIRMDALGETSEASIGIESRLKVRSSNWTYSSLRVVLSISFALHHSRPNALWCILGMLFIMSRACYIRLKQG